MRAVMIIALLASGAGSAFAGPCETAVTQAAAGHDVPERVLRAVALVESGVGGSAWPWTVNVAGKGARFDTREAALEHLESVRGQGVRSFDVGCMQLNYRWHGASFDDLNAMLDPTRNADYAARFLKRLHAETGNWLAAARAYHSRTPSYSARYGEKLHAALARIFARIPEETAPVSPVRASERRREARGAGGVGLAAFGGGGSGLLSAAKPLIGAPRP